jgi:hypothetical protein
MRCRRQRRLRNSQKQPFNWLSFALFGLILPYGLMGLIRLVDFNLLTSLSLTVPATICGILSRFDRLKSLSVSFFRGVVHISLTMQEPNKGARGSRNQRSHSTRNALSRNGKSDRQTEQRESNAQKSP